MGMLVEDLLTLARLDEQRPLHVDGPLVVRGDEARLRQVLNNLMSNALQHTAADASVEVRVRRDGEEAVVQVSDDGPGMSQDTASRVFEQFFRADASRTRASGGSGLGLSIVASLVGPAPRRSPR